MTRRYVVITDGKPEFFLGLGQEEASIGDVCATTKILAECQAIFSIDVGETDVTIKPIKDRHKTIKFEL